MVMRLYGWMPLTLGHHDATFGGFSHCGSGDEMFLMCHMISKDHVFKGLRDFIRENPSQ